MFYEVQDKEITKRLNDWKEMRAIRLKRASEIAKKYGATKLLITDSTFHGVQFNDKPDKTWSRSRAGYKENIYRPHGAKKSAIDMRKDFEEIIPLNPTLETISKTLLNYKMTFSKTSNEVSFYPGIKKTKKGVFLLETPNYVDEYLPPKGIVEITNIRYKELCEEC